MKVIVSDDFLMACGTYFCVPGLVFVSYNKLARRLLLLLLLVATVDWSLPPLSHRAFSIV